MVLACGSKSLLFTYSFFLFICYDFFYETSSDVLIPIYFSFAKQSTSFVISLFLKTCQMERKETKYRTKQVGINNNNTTTTTTTTTDYQKNKIMPCFENIK